MRLFLNGLVLGLILGIAGYWLYDSRISRPERLSERVESKSSPPANADLRIAPDIEHAITAKLEALDLHTSAIRDELARTGKVIRRKATELGTSVSDATRDAKATAIIKAKLAADPQLSALQITVDTTNGIVTLGGTVPTADSIGRAMLHALQTPDVDRVVSTLQPG